VFPTLHPTPAEPLPFAPSLAIRAFVLERDAGDVLIYSNGSIDVNGGIARHYLNHRHEAMFASDVHAPLFVHAAERDAVAGRYHVRGTWSRRHTLDDDFEVIPTPGHTPGATAFLWTDGDGRRFLFTGDTVYLRDGEWVAAVLDGSSDRDAYIESLELMRGLDFDVLVPWAASADQPWYAVTSADDARARIDAILARVRAGEDH